MAEPTEHGGRPPSRGVRRWAGNVLAWVTGPGVRRALDRRLPPLERRLDTQVTALQQLQQRLEQNLADVRQAHEQAAAARDRADALERTVAAAESAVRRLHGELTRLTGLLLADPLVDEQAPAPPADADAGSPAFAHLLYGSRDLACGRLEEYVADFAEVGPVVELDCGRGGFLEACRHAGLAASGIDPGAELLAEARAAGLEVAEGTATAWLAAQPAASVGGLFSSRLLSRTRFESLLPLLRDCRRVLRPGGRATFETLNPNHPAAFRHFYRDPTHRRPLFPEVAAFLATAAGFPAPAISYPRWAGDFTDPAHEAPAYTLRLVAAPST